MQLGLVARRVEVLGDGVDAARPDDGLLVLRAHGQHLKGSTHYNSFRNYQFCSGYLEQP